MRPPGAPPGPFDGAACLLVMHFLSREERLRVLRQLRTRLRPGAALVTAHHGSPTGSDPRRWLSIAANFADGTGVDPARGAGSGARMAEHLMILSDAEEEALFRQAGYAGAALFYAELSFRGWVAEA